MASGMRSACKRPQGTDGIINCDFPIVHYHNIIIMVITNAQGNAFFTEDAQMGLSARTQAFLATEGINTIDDLGEFTTKEDWTQIVANAKKPPRIPDPNNQGMFIEDEPYRIPTKSLNRLRVAAQAVKHFEETGRELTAALMQWNPRLKNFERQWKAMKDASDKDHEEAPKVSRSLGIVKFLESFENFVTQIFGVRQCRLSYVIRSDAFIPGAAPALAPNAPHSAIYGSISADRVALLSHDDPLFADDDAMVFDHLEAGVRGTKFAHSIEQFKRDKRGREAFLALQSQYAGIAMWDSEVTANNDFLLNRKWTGTTSFTLERYLNQHRAAYVSLTRCAEHVSVQLPDERTRVGFIVSNIESTDSDVKATIAAIKVDDTPGGLRRDFERAVALLLPTCPVKRKRSGKRKSAEISEISAQIDEGAEIASMKVSRGPVTGIELRYYKPEEYAKLSKAQKKELKEHRTPPADGKGVGARTKKRAKVTSKKAIKAQVAAVMKDLADEQKERENAVNQFRDLLAQASGVIGNTPDPKSSNAKANESKDDSKKADVASANLLSIFDRMVGGAKGGNGAQRG